MMELVGSMVLIRSSFTLFSLHVKVNLMLRLLHMLLDSEETRARSSIDKM